MVNAPPGEEGLVRIPRDFLLQRSRTFRDLLNRVSSLSDSDQLQLGSTSLKTIEDFLIWSHSRTPQIDEEASFEDTVKLGIFAFTYQIPALSNQITDQIRNKLAGHDWQLSADMVNDVYAATSPGSPLREVIRAALGQLPKPIGEEWKSTFLNHAHLGWDYSEAGETEWSAQEFLAKVCRFHDHEDMARRVSTEGEKCPYRAEECYFVEQDLEQEEGNVGEVNGDDGFENRDSVANETREDAMVNGDAPHAEGEPTAAADGEEVKVEGHINGEPVKESRARDWLLKEDTGYDDDVNGTVGGTSESIEPRESESGADLDGQTVLSEQTNEVCDSIAYLSIDDAVPDIYEDGPPAEETVAAEEEAGPPPEDKNVAAGEEILPAPEATVVAEQEGTSWPKKSEVTQTVIETPAVGLTKAQKRKSKRKPSKG